MLLSGYAFASDSRSLHGRKRLRQMLRRITRASNIRGSDTRREMSSVCDHLMPFVKRCSFERWDVAEPSRARPSLLYSLIPCGLGTPYVESLSSYVTRLAEGHVVSVWRVILHVLSPVRPSQIPRSSTRYSYPANGLGKGS